MAKKISWVGGILLIALLYAAALISLFIPHFLAIWSMTIFLALIWIVIAVKWDTWSFYLKNILVVIGLHIFLILFALRPCLRLGSDCSMVQYAFMIPLFLFEVVGYLPFIDSVNEFIFDIIFIILNLVLLCLLGLLIGFIIKKIKRNK